MSPDVIAALVRLVANGRKFRVADAVIIEHLIEMGVPHEHAPALLTEISQGLQHGNDHAMNGTNEPPTSPPVSPLYLAAFTAGQHAVSEQQRLQRSHRVMMVVIAMLVIGGVLYFAWR